MNIKKISSCAKPGLFEDYVRRQFRKTWQNPSLVTLCLLLWLGTSPAGTLGVNLKAPMFVGGVPQRVRVAPDVGVVSGFDGCLSKVILQAEINFGLTLVLIMWKIHCEFSKVWDFDELDHPGTRRLPWLYQPLKLRNIVRIKLRHLGDIHKGLINCSWRVWGVHGALLGC